MISHVRVVAQLSREPHNHDRHGDGKEIFAGCQSVPSHGIGRTLQGPSKTETKNFHMAVLLTAKPPAKTCPLRIDPQGSAVQK